jgi:hypothetical protein
MEALLKRQKDIISATHKLINNKEKFKSKEWIDNIHAVGANQTKAAEQTNTLVERMSRRGLTNQDKMIKQMAENLKNAIEQMNPAAEQLKAEKPDAAEPFEQKALQYLMRADSLFNEIQVHNGVAAEAAAEAASRNAQDLADLFELELDQNKNQYETVQRGEMQQSSQEVDEALRKLKELAERQQKLQERRARQQQQGGGGGGGEQMTAQELQRETEKLARQLDKLSRENNDRQMADAARALNQAAQNMQRQSQNGNAQSQQQAAQAAQEQLQRAQSLLSQGRNGTMEERLAKAQQQAKRLSEEQKKISEDTQQLAQNPGAAGDARRRAQEINQQRDGMATDLKSLMNDLDSLSNSQENRDAAGKARTANNTIKSQQVPERIENGKRILDAATPQNNYYQYAVQNDKAIEKALDDVQKQIGQAASAANNSEENKLQTALNQAGDIIQRLESMRQRQQALQQQQGQQGSTGPAR